MSSPDSLADRLRRHGAMLRTMSADTAERVLSALADEVEKLENERLFFSAISAQGAIIASGRGPLSPRDVAETARDCAEALLQELTR